MKKTWLFTNGESVTRTPDLFSTIRSQGRPRRGWVVAEIEAAGKSLESCVGERLRAEGRLLDCRRVTLRVLALAVRLRAEAERRSRTPPSERILSRAIGDILVEQTREEFEDEPLDRSPSREFYAALSQATGIEFPLVRRVCVFQNALPRAERLWLLERTPVALETREGKGPLEPTMGRAARLLSGLRHLLRDERGRPARQEGAQDVGGKHGTGGGGKVLKECPGS